MMVPYFKEEETLKIRNFEPGDEGAQLRIFNEAAAKLPKFKPATLDEIRRRSRAADFDPNSRLFAMEGGQPVAYASFHGNGRVSYPWCLPGHEALAEPLFQKMLETMQERGIRTAFAAYRGDWNPLLEFFLARGFRQAREMINFVLDLVEMPTPAARRSTTVSPLRPADLPALAALAPGALRTTSTADLERHFLHNPYFPPEAVFVLRGSTDGLPSAAGVLIGNAAYANPKQVDASMPCFRLGAFGTEGMQTKRINGLFSFLAKSEDANRLGLELMNHAALRLRNVEIDAFAAQAPSDVPHLLRFYQSHFRRQGSFPVLERELTPAADKPTTEAPTSSP
jgi:hypothetical protein